MMTAIPSLAQAMNQFARLLEESRTERQWYSAIAETAAKFAAQTAIFQLTGETLTCVAVHGAPSEGLLGVSIPLAEAPAFRTVRETGEAVIALRRAAELSAPVAATFSQPGINKAYLVPTKSKDVLYAEGHDVDLSALEILLRIAGGTKQPEADWWRELSPEDKRLHLNARRFAAVSVAGIVLNHPLDLQAGRRRKSLYAALRTDLTALRDQFERRFASKTGNMPDYLHIEIVSRLANDDISLLGAEYPGQLH